MKKEFGGNLEWIDPNKIIKEDEDNKVGSFFVGLGVIFNDLKDLILFEQLIADNYRQPEIKERSSHSGSFGGLLVHINRLFVGIINEFFIFLKENEDILSTAEFKNICKKLPREERENWNGMVEAANGRLPKVSGFLKTLLLIRNNIGYHYYQSGKILSKGFVSRFSNEQQDKRNEKAYYSIDETIEKTRFYFSDAAVEEALFIETGKGERKKFTNDPNVEKYQMQMKATIYTMTKTIMLLLKKFLQSRRNNQ